MKRLFLSIVALMIINMITMPASAEQSAYMSVTASQNELTKGDTFTVTVSTTVVENCYTGGFMFSYNKDVFEYVNGTALVKGFSVSGVTDMAGSLSGYFMNTSTGTTIQGTLFQVTFKVKDNSPAGSYVISGTPSLTVLNGKAKDKISCSAGSIAVAIACDHSYSSWEKADDSFHTRKCSVCQDILKEQHRWENTPINGNVNIFTCTICHATNSDTTPVVCIHMYDHNCDVDCNVCGEARAISHQYEPSWHNDRNNHWNECAVCKDKKDVSAHIPDPEADSAGEQLCTICGYVIASVIDETEHIAEPVESTPIVSVDNGSFQQVQISVISIAAAFSVAVIGIVILLFVKKKS